MAKTNLWLRKLKIVELHRLAVLLGTPCSGSKASRITGIERAIAVSQNASFNPGQSTIGQSIGQDEETRPAPKRVSLISIDMGIRNLAFACFSAEIRDDGPERESPMQCKDIKLEAWQKMDVSKPTGETVDDLSQQVLNGPEQTRSIKDSNTSPTYREEEATASVSRSKVGPQATEVFEPSVYADHAYRIITSIINEHKPTHILIERQRFRSGGSSAVLEWTIRVGMLEGMLYAVLRTLAGDQIEAGATPAVEGMLPARINRLWFEGGHMTNRPVCTTEEEDTTSFLKIKGKDMKKAKIQIVSRLLANTKTCVSKDETGLAPLKFKPSEDVLALVDHFEEEVGRSPNSRRQGRGGSSGPISETKMSKLDDLADCLLQGLTWLKWQNNRMRILTLGENAFQLGDVRPAVKKKKQKTPK